MSILSIISDFDVVYRFYIEKKHKFKLEKSRLIKKIKFLTRNTLAKN